MWASFKKVPYWAMPILLQFLIEIQISDSLSGFISLVLDSFFNAGLQNYFPRYSSRYLKTSADVYCTE